MKKSSSNRLAYRWPVLSGRGTEESVNKTGRLVVTHEAPITSGFGAEVVASIASKCFLRLEAPPLRVCGYDTPFPLAHEPAYLPGKERLVEGIINTCKF
jgi:2-oxoisovalerate dehydrogenase E1 component beta subunit